MDLDVGKSKGNVADLLPHGACNADFVSMLGGI